MCWRHKQYISVSLNGGALLVKDRKAFSTYLQNLPLRPWLTLSILCCQVTSDTFPTFSFFSLFPNTKSEHREGHGNPRSRICAHIMTNYFFHYNPELGWEILDPSILKAALKLFVASQQSFLLKVGGKISQRERERERCPISKWWPVQTEFTLQIVNLTLLRLTNFTMFSVFFVLKWSSATAAYIRTNFHLAVVIATLWMWLAWLG